MQYFGHVVFVVALSTLMCLCFPFFWVESKKLIQIPEIHDICHLECENIDLSDLNKMFHGFVLLLRSSREMLSKISKNNNKKA